MISKIGRYEVKMRLGKGGMATVYQGYDPQFKRDVAIKVLPKEFLHNAEFRSRFEREATTVATLEHSAIVPVYDFGEDDGQPFLVMRYMGGGSLRQRIDDGKLTGEKISTVVERIAGALDYAHQQGVIHRDLKPENILFDQHDEPFLSDFGIAKLAESGATLTGNAIVGTPAYMSPEQGRGDADIDGRGDIYSLGAMTFEMVMGFVPYEASSPTGQIMKHLTDPIPVVKKIKPNIEEDWQPVFNKVLAKRKHMRFGTAKEFSEAVLSVVNHQPLQFKEIDPAKASKAEPVKINRNRVSDKHSKRVKKYRRQQTGRRISASTVILLILVVGAIVYVAGSTFNLFPEHWNVPRLSFLTSEPVGGEFIETIQPSTQAASAGSETPDATDTPQPVAETETPFPTNTPGPTAAPTRTPAGPMIGGADMIAFVNNNDIWISALDGSDLRQITATGGEKRGLQWLPDGQTISFISGLCIQSVDIETPIPQTILCANWAEYVGAFELSPDHAWVALTLDTGLYILPFNLDAIKNIRTETQLDTHDYCVHIDGVFSKMARWGEGSDRIAVVMVVPVDGRPVDLIRVYDVSNCDLPPHLIDEFPGERFTVPRYDITPTIVDFDWDGDVLFTIAVSTLNNFGEIYEYNLTTKLAKEIVPIFDGVTPRCCYRGFLWSPNREYFVFAYQDSRFGVGAQLYYVIYGTLGTNSILTPIDFPDDIFSGAQVNPQAALRP